MYVWDNGCWWQLHMEECTTPVSYARFLVWQICTLLLCNEFTMVMVPGCCLFSPKDRPLMCVMVISYIIGAAQVTRCKHECIVILLTQLAGGELKGDIKCIGVAPKIYPPTTPDTSKQQRELLFDFWSTACWDTLNWACANMGWCNLHAAQRPPGNNTVICGPLASMINSQISHTVNNFSFLFLFKARPWPMWDCLHNSGGHFKMAGTSTIITHFWNSWWR